MMLKSARSFRLCLLVMASFVVACGGDGGGGSSGGPSGSLTSTFLTSTSMTTNIEVGDTIQFEVTVTTISGQDYNAVLWSLTGDATAAATTTKELGWANVSHNVTNWAWNYSPSGSGMVKIGTNGTITPFAPPLTTPDRVAGYYGFLAGVNGSISKTGDGTPALVGTVTITADTVGSSFRAGAFQIPGFDGFLDGIGINDPPTVTLGTFTVIPPP